MSAPDIPFITGVPLLSRWETPTGRILVSNMADVLLLNSTGSHGPTGPTGASGGGESGTGATGPTGSSLFYQVATNNFFGPTTAGNTSVSGSDNLGIGTGA